MNANPPKKQPATVTGDPKDIELEQQIREHAYELYEARGRQDGHEHRLRLICADTPSQKVRQAPDRSGAFLWTLGSAII